MGVLCWGLQALRVYSVHCGVYFWVPHLYDNHLQRYIVGYKYMFWVTKLVRVYIVYFGVYFLVHIYMYILGYQVQCGIHSLFGCICSWG